MAEQGEQNKGGMFESGMAILAENQKRKNWEDLQMTMKMLEPPTMQLRKLKDAALREEQKKIIEVDGGLSLGEKYLNAWFLQVQILQDKLYTALQEGDTQAEKDAMMGLSIIEQEGTLIKKAKAEFFMDNFDQPELISNGVSEQQVSFGTQIYCKNPELKIVFSSQRDVDMGRRDYYGRPIEIGKMYAIVQDFWGIPCLLKCTDGNKDIFVIDRLSAMEYMTFVKKLYDDAQAGAQKQAAVSIDLNGINYKMDTLFGLNDGTATKDQDQRVLSFCHDADLLQDGATFYRHLMEHPNIQNLNHGSFDIEAIDKGKSPIMPLGPGDKDHWSDNVTEMDKLRLVRAITNPDSKWFQIDLLRTLVKEYFTHKCENSWWKGMGYPEGKLGLMRHKQLALLKSRFDKAKAQATLDGKQNFDFDGKVYPTGTKGKDMTELKPAEEVKNKKPTKADKEVPPVSPEQI